MILVTGGAGYIGSHTCVELINAGHKVVIVDNFCNSDPSVVESIRDITGKDVVCVDADVRDKDKLLSVFKDYDISAVVHFAGHKAVGESVSKPLSYYQNNLDSTLTLCEVMDMQGVRTLIFSSSATVYDPSNDMPLVESATLGCTNPYGWTKLMNEQILRDLATANESWSIVSLRYFNPIGAHESGKIGERPSGIPNNLMPYITQVAAGVRDKLHVFGNDYPTADGTGVRDYIHVVDLAQGHVRALEYAQESRGAQSINLGSGTGCSVLQIIHAFEQATGITIPYVIDPRRPGDIAVCFADTSKAKQLLNWQTQLDINQMCEDAWRFESQS
ncbi:MAG: UDP-glucose 4-epimerase GalE [Clostridia bacterium]|jgi:UDP-glucose 4-epimerase|nr:UDP-glucose 4-epimerase GalE [Clostridia bacterium]MBT7121788.1 UDP-glucose 4-epimerase GalE [Clostridia bacterium]